MAKIILKTQTTPTTPASGDAAIFVDTTDSKLKKVTDAGVEHTMASETYVDNKVEVIEDSIKTNLTLGEDMLANDITTLKSDGKIYKFNGVVDDGVISTTQNNYSIRNCFIDTNKIITVGADNDNVVASIGDINGTTITYGTEQTITTTAYISVEVVKVDTNTGIIFVYSNGSTYTAYPFIVSGTTITVGTGVTVNTNTSTLSKDIDVCLVDTGKIVFTFVQGGHIWSRVGLVSGNVLTLGTAKEVFASAASYPTGVKIDTNKVLYSMVNGNYISKYVGTISGTTISVASQYSTTYSAATSLTSYPLGTDFVLNILDDTLKTWVEFVSISGTVATTISSSPAGDNFVLNTHGKPYMDFGNNIVGIISSVVSSRETITLFIKDETNKSFYELGNMDLITMKDTRGSNPYFSYSNFIQMGNGFILGGDYVNKKTHFINYDIYYLLGILKEDGLEGNNGQVFINGQISTGHTGLTVGAKYYINYDGTYTTNPTVSNTTTIGHVGLLGRAISDTEILVNI